MPLFVSTVGATLDVEMHLLEIVGGEGGLGETAVAGDTTVLQIIYSTSSAGFSQTRIAAIVNTIVQPIVLIGVPSSHILTEPAGAVGQPISNFGGITYELGGAIRIVYDVGQCGGSQYFVFNAGGAQISSPSFILLFHELAHAFHLAIGDSPPPGSAAEFQAITDENQCRAQYGMVLRDPNNHGGGCGFSGTGGGSSCFIASAAFDSPVAPQVGRLRLIRDALLRQSVIGEALFQHIHAEYYQISPHVVAAMRSDAAARILVADLLVTPLLNLFTLTTDFVQLAWQPRDLREPLLAMVSQGAALSATHDCSAGEMHQYVQALLQDNPSAAVKSLRVHSSLTQVAHLLTSNPAGVYVRWALLEPLCLYWSTVAAIGGCGETGLAGVIDDLMAAIGHWLVMFPIPIAVERLERSVLVGDLALLSQTVFVAPAIRRALAARLIALLADRVPYDLPAMLRAAGYLPPVEGGHDA